MGGADLLGGECWGGVSLNSAGAQAQRCVLASTSLILPGCWKLLGAQNFYRGDENTQADGAPPLSRCTPLNAFLASLIFGKNKNTRMSCMRCDDNEL